MSATYKLFEINDFYSMNEMSAEIEEIIKQIMKGFLFLEL